MNNIPLTKPCKICKKEKPLNEFRNQKAGKYGKKSYCIPCDDEYNKKKYEDNKEIRKLQVSMWNEDNPDKVKEYKEKWKNKNNK